MANNIREERGKEIAQQENQIKRIDENEYDVYYFNHGDYELRILKSRLDGSCPDHIYRGSNANIFLRSNFQAK